MCGCAEIHMVNWMYLYFLPNSAWSPVYYHRVAVKTHDSLLIFLVIFGSPPQVIGYCDETALEVVFFPGSICLSGVDQSVSVVFLGFKDPVPESVTESGISGSSRKTGLQAACRLVFRKQVVRSRTGPLLPLLVLVLEPEDKNAAVHLGQCQLI